MSVRCLCTFMHRIITDVRGFFCLYYLSPIGQKKKMIIQYEYICFREGLNSDSTYLSRFVGSYTSSLQESVDLISILSKEQVKEHNFKSNGRS